MLEIDEGILRPEVLAQLLARNHLSWSFQQNCEYPKGLPRKTAPEPTFLQFPGLEVQFEIAERHTRLNFAWHGRNPLRECYHTLGGSNPCQLTPNVCSSWPVILQLPKSEGECIDSQSSP